jgi:hypothetical protein
MHWEKCYELGYEHVDETTTYIYVRHSSIIVEFGYVTDDEFNPAVSIYINEMRVNVTGVFERAEDIAGMIGDSFPNITDETIDELVRLRELICNRYDFALKCRHPYISSANYHWDENDFGYIGIYYVGSVCVFETNSGSGDVEYLESEEGRHTLDVDDLARDVDIARSVLYCIMEAQIVPTKSAKSVR